MPVLSRAETDAILGAINTNGMARCYTVLLKTDAVAALFDAESIKGFISRDGAFRELAYGGFDLSLIARSFVKVLAKRDPADAAQDIIRFCIFQIVNSANVEKIGKLTNLTVRNQMQAAVVAWGLKKNANLESDALTLSRVASLHPFHYLICLRQAGDNASEAIRVSGNNLPWWISCGSILSILPPTLATEAEGARVKYSQNLSKFIAERTDKKNVKDVSAQIAAASKKSTFFDREAAVPFLVSISVLGTHAGGPPGDKQDLIYNETHYVALCTARTLPPLDPNQLGVALQALQAMGTLAQG